MKQEETEKTEGKIQGRGDVLLVEREESHKLETLCCYVNRLFECFGDNRDLVTSNTVDYPSILHHCFTTKQHNVNGVHNVSDCTFHYYLVRNLFFFQPLHHLKLGLWVVSRLCHHHTYLLPFFPTKKIRRKEEETRKKPFLEALNRTWNTTLEKP